MDDTLIGERADLLQTLATHRNFLRFTARGLTEEQIRQRSTASELCIGGLLRHVAEVERTWAKFIVDGPGAFGTFDEPAMAAHQEGFQVGDGETLESLLAAYGSVASATDELVRGLDDLGTSQPLPEAPWFQPGATRSARRVLMHVIAETAQHAGHADIIREAIDGQKTMG
ncbi:MAG: DinB family protein [Acidimicrobiales bacterium]